MPDYKDAQRKQNHWYKKQTICSPLLHRGALGPWFPHGVEAVVPYLLHSQGCSVPHRCRLRAPYSTFPQNKPNAIGYTISECLCVLAAAITSCLLRCLRRAALPASPAPCPLGPVVWKGQKTVPLFLLQKLPRSLCQGQQTKPHGFCNYPGWHLLPCDQPQCQMWLEPEAQWEKTRGTRAWLSLCPDI